MPAEDVRAARQEEIGYMQSGHIWDEVPVEECGAQTGKGPVSVRWVDVNKGGPDKMEVRCRLVARDFEGNDKDRDDLFAETPPLEAKRMLFSRPATPRKDGRFRKLLFIDARKAHLNPKCEEGVHIELPAEVGAPEGTCSKLVHWLYGVRPAVAAWEKHYSSLLEGCGFRRGVSCGVVFYHPDRDLALVVHGDVFTFCGADEDLKWVQHLMKSWFEIKRALVGQDNTDDKSVVILGRVLMWMPEGLEYKAGPKHRDMILEYFGVGLGSKPLGFNGEKSQSTDEDWELEALEPAEARTFSGLVARANFVAQDSPDLQFPVKELSQEMSSPKVGSWKRLKKFARYLLGRGSMVWRFEWQDEPRYSHVSTDSDWGGSRDSRKSTSAGVWMLGEHCIKTRSVTQGAFALSSAEAEFYAMVEGVTRAKGLHSLMSEVGFVEVENIIHLRTDSSAANSFVCRRGLVRMRHLEIRDLCLQKEVREGRLIVSKVKGTENPADIGTQFLSVSEIVERLGFINIRYEVAKCVSAVGCWQSGSSQSCRPAIEGSWLRNPSAAESAKNNADKSVCMSTIELTAIISKLVSARECVFQRFC